jgi:hypothetical protein
VVCGVAAHALLHVTCTPTPPPPTAGWWLLPPLQQQWARGVPPHRPSHHHTRDVRPRLVPAGAQGGLARRQVCAVRGPFGAAGAACVLLV